MCEDQHSGRVWFTAGRWLVAARTPTSEADARVALISGAAGRVLNSVTLADGAQHQHALAHGDIAASEVQHVVGLGNFDFVTHIPVAIDERRLAKRCDRGRRPDRARIGQNMSAGVISSIHEA